MSILRQAYTTRFSCSCGQSFLSRLHVSRFRQAYNGPRIRLSQSVLYCVTCDSDLSAVAPLNQENPR